MKKSQNNPHAHHRSRLKKRFLTEGLDSFEPHIILELFLFFCIPQCDTNITAHTLLERFGSLSAVFDADYDELCSVDGIGEHSATLIKLMPEIWKIYHKEKTELPQNNFSLEEISEYLVHMYSHENTEVIFILMFDNLGRLIDSKKMISVSSNISQQLPLNEVITALISKKASSFILSHNHPGGSCEPSEDDISFSRYLSDLFSKFDIHMIAHIIVADKRYKIIEL